MAWLKPPDKIGTPVSLGKPLRRRPRIPDLMFDGDFADAGRDVRLTAIAWAKDWLGLLGTVDEEAALADLDTAIMGKRRDHASDEGRILLMARAALYHWREAANHTRTADSFPWSRFVAVEVQRSCSRAQAKHGQIVAFGSRERIPLDRCDAERCDCHYLQMTDGQRNRMLRPGGG